MNAKEVIQYIQQHIHDFTYIVLKNVSMNEDEFLKEISQSSIIKLVENNDGFISHITQKYIPTDMNSAIDNSRNTTNFDMHTDGPYYESVPEIIGLYCINPGIHNATTYISDTHKALYSLQQSEINILKNLQYTYIAKDGRLYARNLIEKDPLSGEDITNMSSRGFVAPFIEAGKELPNLFITSEIITKLYKSLEDCISYEHTWERGDLFLFNNNKYLHGRKGTLKDTERHLWRLWIGAK